MIRNRSRVLAYCNAGMLAGAGTPRRIYMTVVLLLVVMSPQENMVHYIRNNN